MTISRHPPSRGTHRYHSTKAAALADTKRDSTFVSRSLAHYPELLARYISSKVKIAVLSSSPTTAAVTTPMPFNPAQCEKVNFREVLTANQVDQSKLIAENQAIGGLRNTHHAVSKLSVVRDFGKHLGRELIQLVNTQHARAAPGESWIDCMLAKLGSQNPRGTPCDAVEKVKSIIIQHCGSHYTGEPARPPTDINVALLKAWQTASCDPDTAVIEWLTFGAPAGITCFAEPCGIFPPLDDIPELSTDDLQTGDENFVNYAGVEGNSVAIDELREHIQLGHLKVFSHHQGGRRVRGRTTCPKQNRHCNKMQSRRHHS